MQGSRFERFCRVGTEGMSAAPSLQCRLQRTCRALADAPAAQEEDLSIGGDTGHWLSCSDSYSISRLRFLELQ